MDLNENAEIDTSQVSDRRRGGGGGLAGIPIPTSRGGLITTVVALLLMLAGGGYVGSNLLDDGGDVDQTCATANPNRLQEVECRNALFINSIQDYWRDALPQHFGKPYELTDTVFFSGTVSTACGQASSGVGPFYCPTDDQVYIDLRFWDELANRFGAEGEFAQPYVLAHEYGHHVQDLLGTEAQVRRAQERDPGNANRYSVMLELQADCYAGAWTRHAAQTADASGKPIFTSITDADINQALDAAAAVGDDAIQQKMGGGVDESAFTHGSSADRQRWFRAGYAQGDPTDCDTFGNAL